MENFSEPICKILRLTGIYVNHLHVLSLHVKFNNNTCLGNNISELPAVIFCSVWCSRFSFVSRENDEFRIMTEDIRPPFVHQTLFRRLTLGPFLRKAAVGFVCLCMLAGGMGLGDSDSLSEVIGDRLSDGH